LSNLFEKTLANWHRGKRVLEHERTLAEIYEERLLPAEAYLDRWMFQRKVQAILSQIPALNTNIKFKDDTFELQFGRRTFTYTDPTNILFQEIASDQAIVLTNTPGTLSGTNIVTNADGRAWVTDFLDAGLAPLSWNFAALEAAIRFDWVEISDFQRLHEMERCLVESRFNRLEINMVEPIVKKPVRAVQTIRQLALPAVGEDELPYHLAVFYHAASRIAKFDLDSPYPPADLFRFAHILIAMSILAEKIHELSQGSTVVDRESKELYMDKAQHEVWVRGRKVSVLRDSYRLLEYLYDHANQICKRADIARHVFDIENYDKLSVDAKKLEVNRMNTAIRGLREKIEDDPDMPRYLITREGFGYCLILSPEG
jgi:DNA-binding winged helix-turn-helix (wHTH) protein